MTAAGSESRLQVLRTLVRAGDRGLTIGEIGERLAIPASILIDPPSLLVTASALGWQFAIGKALAAVFLGLFGGFGLRLLMSGGVLSSPLRGETTNGGCGAPASLIGGTVGSDGLGPIILGALVGMPAYLNSYAAPPLVAGLMEQGMGSGAAMAFMIAGAISSIPAMTAVWSLVRRPVFFAYLGFGIAGAILFGSAFAIL